MPTKKRQPRNAALAHQVRDRLEELRVERGISYSAFATAARVQRPQYDAWRNGGRVPGGFYVRRLAEAFGVTADWLLGIPYAAKFAGQGRSAEALESDLAQHLARQLAERVAPAWPHITAGMLQVDVAVVLRLGLDQVGEWFETSCREIDGFYRPAGDGSSHWETVFSRLAKRAASHQDYEQRHDFAADILALRFADARRRAERLFSGAPVMVREQRADDFFAPFERKNRAAVVNSVRKLTGAESAIRLAMVPSSAKLTDDEPVSRPDARAVVRRLRRPAHRD